MIQETKTDELWSEVYSDHDSIGRFSFLNCNTTHYSEIDKKYVKTKAVITSITPYFMSSVFETYNLKYVNLGFEKEFTIRKNLRPQVHRVLEIPESESLEGTVIAAYFKNPVEEENDGIFNVAGFKKWKD